MAFNFSKIKALSAEDHAAQNKKQMANMSHFLCGALAESGLPDRPTITEEPYSVTAKAQTQGAVSVEAVASMSAASNSETEGFLSLYIAARETTGKQNWYEIRFPEREHLNGKRVFTNEPTPTMFLALAKIVEAAKTKPISEIIELMRIEAKTESIRERSGGSTNKIALDLPFSKKDEAKLRFGQKLEWNKAEKTWYFLGDKLPEGLKAYEAQQINPK